MLKAPYLRFLTMKTSNSHLGSNIYLEKCNFLLKLGHFNGHFEFLSVSDVRGHRRSKNLPDLESTSNLAIEQLGFY